MVVMVGQVSRMIMKLDLISGMVLVAAVEIIIVFGMCKHRQIILGV